MNNKNQHNMKATTTIITLMLALSAGILLAGNDRFSTTISTETSTITLAAVAPGTPREATFEDFAAVTEFAGLVPVTPAEATFEEFVVMSDFAGLAPVMPSEASFEEIPSDMVSINDLAPLTPVAADFEDAIESVAIDNSVLAPVTPAEADFE
jgi:hypothetical protein